MRSLRDSLSLGSRRSWLATTNIENSQEGFQRKKAAQFPHDFHSCGNQRPNGRWLGIASAFYEDLLPVSERFWDPVKASAESQSSTKALPESKRDLKS